MNDKEIYAELWKEYHNRDRIEWLKNYIHDSILLIPQYSNYTDRIIFSRDHFELILEGLEKL